MKRKIDLRIFKILQLILLYFSFITSVIWISFVVNGYFRLGYLPKYGHEEFILFSNEKIHFALLIFAMYVNVFGALCWFFLLFLKLFFDFNSLNLKYSIVGSAIFVLNFLFMFTKQFEWILD